MVLLPDQSLLLDLRDRLLDLGDRKSLPPGVPIEAPPQELERVGPFAELMFLIMVADDHDSEQEHTALRGAFRALTGGRFSSSLLDEWLIAFQRALEREGRDSRLESICSAFANDREDAEGAFNLAAAMSLADGDLDASEVRLLDQVARWLNLGKDRADALLSIQRRGRVG